jgi:hypothetical protein
MTSAPTCWTAELVNSLLTEPGQSRGRRAWTTLTGPDFRNLDKQTTEIFIEHWNEAHANNESLIFHNIENGPDLHKTMAGTTYAEELQLMMLNWPARCLLPKFRERLASEAREKRIPIPPLQQPPPFERPAPEMQSREALLQLQTALMNELAATKTVLQTTEANLRNAGTLIDQYREALREQDAKIANLEAALSRQISEKQRVDRELEETQRLCDTQLKEIAERQASRNNAQNLTSSNETHRVVLYKLHKLFSKLPKSTIQILCVDWNFECGHLAGAELRANTTDGEKLYEQIAGFSVTYLRRFLLSLESHHIDLGDLTPTARRWASESQETD